MLKTGYEEANLDNLVGGNWGINSGGGVESDW